MRPHRQTLGTNSTGWISPKLTELSIAQNTAGSGDAARSEAEYTDPTKNERSFATT